MICDNLQHHDKYKPKKLKIPSLTKFDEMNVDEVTQIIQLMATKICELDLIPTMVLKRFLKDLAPIINRIVNISLQTGTFATAWKISIICPLLKKVGLDLTLAHYRPLSNLSFISKVVEKGMLSQFENTAININSFQTIRVHIFPITIERLHWSSSQMTSCGTFKPTGFSPNSYGSISSI